ncbi:hypothetical protein K7X08_021621 [Anisodus acutangulus]|uniref:Pentatricopeptide repeat-containing protein n=1 Tax=Anisodus acutangulus TaxID=402998 RepID=A0A9Q1RE12_9SOLA|nr:hypothetical protein K7X08_021621 [Anisodus acutangulus]
MKAYDVMPDSYTYNVWMRALSSVNDISGVERVIDEMKRDGRVAEDWTTYSNLASIYADAGLTDKAAKALKKLEKKNACRNFTAYQFLITLYGRIGNLLEVPWRKLKSSRSGAKPNAKTWEIFMDYYLQNGDIKSAIDCVDKAVSIGRGDGGKWLSDM